MKRMGDLNLQSPIETRQLQSFGGWLLFLSQEPQLQRTSKHQTKMCTFAIFKRVERFRVMD